MSASQSLEQAVHTLDVDFLAAVQRGPAHIGAFLERLDHLRDELRSALDTGAVTPELAEQAWSQFSFILAQSQRVFDYNQTFNGVVDSVSSSQVESSLEASTPATRAASIPLFRYFLDNITHPYPDAVEKERVSEQVRELGWPDFDKRKLEDWLNRKRNQSGFGAILRTYCHEDRSDMRTLCNIALFGTAEEKSRLPEGALDDIEDMRDFVQCQHDELAEQKEVAWVDELSTHVRAVLEDDQARDTDSNGDDDDDDDDLSNYDSASDWSATDVGDGDDDTDDEEVPCTVIGTKRKLMESCDFLPFITSRPLSRSFSTASSVSSSSTACSSRSFTGASASSVTTVEWDDDDDSCDRPAKRTRSDSFAFQSEPLPSNSFAEDTLASMTAPADPLFTQYRTKRKRTEDILASRTRLMKRSRYATLGVTSEFSSVSDLHSLTLSGICSIDWVPTEATLADFDVDACAVDCTQPAYQIQVEETIDLAQSDDEPAEDNLTWSKLQVYAIFRLLLPASVRPLPPALGLSMTVSFDTNDLSARDVTSLNQLFALTPEDISAMHESMNSFVSLNTSSATAEIVSPPEDSPSPTSSTSSGCSSPPALSDDSGLSTRSSSVEPDSEQDLLPSPAALSADYGQFYNELFSGKTSSIDSSELQVELGATHDVDVAANELSGAASLLARYLQDSMTAA
uniref:HD1-1 homeodomain protein n=1 Tax=Auricularia auricula-judae TaxID=29892 RepID=A0A6G8IXE0_AURAJ|nr:HD1-1 homeodomain protein [Auricularia auricula-judae]QKI37334.1 homeodomain protein HD1 [Auricularia auricula-judae]